jgi:arsenite-transporting ATPase
LKEGTINSSSQPFTLSKKTSRLKVFTGKGGVGKTTLSLACASALSASGLNVKYLSLAEKLDQDIINKLQIPFLNLSTKESTRTYIEKKVKSNRIAKWITEASFFNALFNMVPSLGDMILLGNIINILEQDPTLYIVLDSPSSGHAIALFESTSLWKKIFQSGPLVRDLEKMISFLNEENHLSIDIVTLPSEMSIQESFELKEQLGKSIPINTNIILNNLISKNTLMENNELPDFLKNKVFIERNILKTISNNYLYVAHEVESDPIDVISNISIKLRDSHE